MRDLAARVLANGPHIETFSKIPPDAPTWNGKVHVILKQWDWDYKVITDILIAACQDNSITNIFCKRVHSNKDCEDGKQLGATSAVFYKKGRECNHSKRVFGEMVTESDSLLRALQVGLDTLTSFLNNLDT